MSKLYTTSVGWSDSDEDEDTKENVKSTPFINIRKIGNLLYYVIPIGFSIFRGDTAIHNPEIIPSTSTFYTTAPELASEYGIVYEFKITKELHLLATDNEETLAELYDIANFSETLPSEEKNKILRIIKKQYGYNTRQSGELLRDTIAHLDKQFVNYLCSMEFPGYAANSMTRLHSTTKYTFHPELVICKPEESVIFIRQITDQSDVKGLVTNLSDRVSILQNKRIIGTPGGNDKKTKNKKPKNKNTKNKKPKRQTKKLKLKRK